MQEQTEATGAATTASTTSMSNPTEPSQMQGNINWAYGKAESLVGEATGSADLQKDVRFHPSNPPPIIHHGYHVHRG